PAKTDQDGPARIVTLSKDSGERNITLGQDGDKYDVRLRTTKTTTNGMPSVASQAKSLSANLTHVVYTRDRSGRVHIYLNGKQNAEHTIEGETSNWNNTFHLALGNENSNDRPWLGTFYLVAIYNRALSPGDIQTNYNAGADAQAAAVIAQSKAQRDAHLFETKIAPLFVEHCFECHDNATRKGGLDLSRKVAALAGGESGKLFVPGKASESLLWEQVGSNDMPKERKPLTDDEKRLLQDWIGAGAVWTADVIDEVNYTQGEKVQQNFVRRLTIDEYIQTVRAAVGVDIAKEAREKLPPDLRADGFSNTAYNLNVDFEHVSAYAQLAEIIASRMDILKFADRFSKSRKLSTDDTMRDFIAAMGKWLLRGPLDQREVTVYSGISTTVASAGGSFEEATRYMIEAMLQSPRFIYRIENQIGDGNVWPVGQHELASRISYMIWGAPPDEQLMKLADEGKLDRSEIEKQARRMLDDPRAIEHSKQFIIEWLNLNRLANLSPDPKKFPEWNSQLAADMRDETIAYFVEVAWNQKRPLADLMNAQITFATPRLAKHYGLKPNGETQLVKYDLSSVPSRGGLLTQGSVLTMGGDEASMVARGLFVLTDVLRGSVKSPPPGLDTTPVPTKAGMSQRSIAENRLSVQTCGLCHVKFEPLAFGLEKFDGIGAFHEKDHHGNKLRDDGKIIIPGEGEPLEYRSSAELMDLLANSPRVSESITWKVAQFAAGRPLGAAEAKTVKQIHE
ncbi:MAG TPA: DUF1592 domain-containing protein, partial [Planctomycetaceae bacterium]|nr:DUF1592 domain-containing protein [Planctomycetaceae bacterium]